MSDTRSEGINPFRARTHNLASINSTQARKSRISCPASRKIRYSIGQTIFHNGDFATHFYQIVAGVVRCTCITSTGQAQIYRFAGSSDFIGLGEGAHYVYSADVVGDCAVTCYRNVYSDHEDDSELQQRIFASQCRELTEMRRRIFVIGRMSAAARLADFLLAVIGLTGGHDGSVQMPVGRSDLADYLCMSPETVCRKLQDFDRIGIIELTTPHVFRVLNRPALEAVAVAR